MRTSKFDELLNKLGTGRWNILYFFVAGFWYFWLPGEFFAGVYLTPEMAYTCIPPENITSDAISSDSCRYSVNETTEEGDEIPVTYPCTEWEYDHSMYTSTLTSEFDLVCDHAYLKATFQSALVFATMFTSMAAGYLADRFGRKNVVVVTQILYSVTSISMSLATSFSSVLALRFITGAFFLPTTYVLAMEVCEIKNRSLVGILTGLPWAIGTMLWGGFAYAIRSWRYLRLTITLPPLLLFPCLYLMDESPRWLILKGDHVRALKVLRKAARWNNVELPPDNEMKQIFLDIQSEQAEASVGEKIAPKKTRRSMKFECKKLTIPRLISTAEMRKITVLLCTIMFMVALCYTGVSLSGNIYGEDPFVYVVILGITQMPSYTVTAPIIKWFGRRKPVICGFVIGGISMIALGFIPANIGWLKLTLAMVGILCFSGSWMMLAVFITEILPTEVRMQGMGTSTLFCQIAGTIAPYISLYLGPLIPWVPSLLYGIASFIAAACMIPMEETKGAAMVETIEELETRSRKKKASACIPATEEEVTKLEV